MAAGVFVALGCGYRKARAPQRRLVGESRRRDLLRARAPGMPISATSSAPQCSRPGSSRWPGLRRKKVTVCVALHRRTHDRAARAVDAARQVDRDHRRARRDSSPRSSRAAAPSPSRSRPAPNSASTIRASGSIAPGAAASIGPVHRAAASPASPLSLLAVADEQHPHRVAALGQNARGDEAVAAIVAGAGHDGDRAALAAARQPASATARPAALHQRRCQAVPPAIVSRSASAISALVSSSIIAQRRSRGTR